MTARRICPATLTRPVARRYDGRDGGLRDQDPTLHPGGVRAAHRAGRVPAGRGHRAHRWRAHGRRAARRPTLHGDPQNREGARGGVRAGVGGADAGADRARRRFGARARRRGRPRGTRRLCSRASLASGTHRGSGRVEPRARSAAQGQSLRPGRPGGLLGAQFDRPRPRGVPGAGPDAAAPFGWRYARSEVLDASARVTPLAAPGSSIPVSRLLP